MEGIERISVIAHGGSNMDYDMYLVIDDDYPMFKTGFYEIRALLIISVHLIDAYGIGDEGCSDSDSEHRGDHEDIHLSLNGKAFSLSAHRKPPPETFIYFPW
jgi:hypothetical protein